MEQGKTGGLTVDKGKQRLELLLGSEAIAAQIFFGASLLVSRSNFDTDCDAAGRAPSGWAATATMR